MFQYRCGKQSVVACSLKNFIMSHFIVATLTQITNIWANFSSCNSVRVYPYAYPQHMKVLKHFLYIKYECGKQSVVVYSLNNVIMPSFHSSYADPNLP